MPPNLTPAQLLPMAALDLDDGDWALVVPVSVTDLSDDLMMVRLRPVGAVRISAN